MKKFCEELCSNFGGNYIESVASIESVDCMFTVLMLLIHVHGTSFNLWCLLNFLS